MTERDPHQEPENSTVSDWHGQKVDRMKEQADTAIKSAENDVTKAEEEFLEETDK
jgi:hypothetical protein